MGTGSAESKAVKKDSVKTQNKTIPAEAVSPLTAWRREGHDFVGIETDAAFDGASFTFLVGNDPATLPAKAVGKDDGSAYTITIAASKAARIDPSYFSGWQFILPVSNVAQAAATPSVVTGQFRSFRSGT